MIRSLTSRQAAELLRLQPSSLHRLLEQDRLPAFELSDGEQRLPSAGLVAALPECFDLARSIRELDAASGAISEAEIASALGDQ